MALGGAWTRVQLAANYILFTGRTFSADADAAILGLNGDAGADTGFTTPAAWPTTGGTAPTDAQLNERTEVTVIARSDNGLAAAGAGVGVHITRGTAPWRVTLIQNGTPNAAVEYEVRVKYVHTINW